MSTSTTRTLVNQLHRPIDLDRAMSWFNGIFSGDDWAMHDRIEVVTPDGRRLVHLIVRGSRWTLEVEIEETRTLGGVLVSARVTDPAAGSELPELTGLARAIVP